MKCFSSGGCFADITPKERAIANGQRSFVSFLLLQLSNSFLRILAVPNKAVFCNTSVLIVTPSFSSHASNLFLTTPSAPTTTGTTSRCLIPHSLPISLSRCWYFSIFSPSFAYTLWSQGEAMSTMIALLFSFSTTTMSGLLDNMVTLDGHMTIQYMTIIIIIIIQGRRVGFWRCTQTQTGGIWGNFLATSSKGHFNKWKNAKYKVKLRHYKCLAFTHNRKSTNFSSARARICVKDATPLIFHIFLHFAVQP